MFISPADPPSSHRRRQNCVTYAHPPKPAAAPHIAPHGPVLVRVRVRSHGPVSSRARFSFRARGATKKPQQKGNRGPRASKRRVSRGVSFISAVASMMLDGGVTRGAPGKTGLRPRFPGSPPTTRLLAFTTKKTTTKTTATTTTTTTMTNDDDKRPRIRCSRREGATIAAAHVPVAQSVGLGMECRRC